MSAGTASEPTDLVCANCGRQYLILLGTDPGHCGCADRPTMGLTPDEESLEAAHAERESGVWGPGRERQAVLALLEGMVEYAKAEAFPTSALDHAITVIRDGNHKVGVLNQEAQA